MTKHSASIVLFTVFAFGLPIWAMQNNEWTGDSVHGCSGECYRQWEQETGGVVVLAQAQAAAAASASPAELGQQKFAGCVACHGAKGEGGVGPKLAGQSASDITDKLTRYKNGETLGAQSALMWAQAAQLDTLDIDHLSAFISTL
ncbi:MAG: c-type cytochrome [Halioglobus sp.]